MIETINLSYLHLTRTFFPSRSLHITSIICPPFRADGTVGRTEGSTLVAGADIEEAEACVMFVSPLILGRLALFILAGEDLVFVGSVRSLSFLFLTSGLESVCAGRSARSRFLDLSPRTS